ncbi:MAG: DUF1062 domain-containing protein [Oscillospiraceae bacterium]
MKVYAWTVVPESAPSVLRNCPKCGVKRPYQSSGLFRVNAQQRNLDVWLVYRCPHCKSSWNLEIYARVRPEQIDPAEYAAFLSNDPETAMGAALDRDILRRNKAEVQWEELVCQVEGCIPGVEELTTPVCIRMQGKWPLPLRADRLLREKLGLSRSAMDKLAEEGRLVVEGNLRKLKLDQPREFVLLPAASDMEQAK